MLHRSATAPLTSAQSSSETPVDNVHSQIVAAEVSTSVFRGAYLNYAELVKQIENLTPQSKRRSSIGDEGAEEDEQDDDHAKFLTALQDSCAFVSRTFENVASNLVRSETGPGRWLRKHAEALLSRVRSRSPSDDSSTEKVQVVAKQCLEFAEVNRQALRAVVDKYEKHFGNGLAAAFIRDCLQPTSPNKQAFLVSPLKDELAAISIESPEAKPLRQRFSFRYFVPPLCAVFTTDADDGDDDEPEFVAESGDSVLQCPICFDVKYEPIGLACGHSFCWHCLQDAAKLTTTFTKTQELKLRIADEHIGAACPLCKSTGVFKSSMPLKALSAKASERFPKQYKKKQRIAEEREKLVLQAFVLQQGIKLTADGIAMGDPVPGGWTHRRLGDSNSSRSSNTGSSGSSRPATPSIGSSSSAPSPGSSSRSPGSSARSVSILAPVPSDADVQGGSPLSTASTHHGVPGFIQNTEQSDAQPAAAPHQ